MSHKIGNRLEIQLFLLSLFSEIVGSSLILYFSIRENGRIVYQIYKITFLSYIFSYVPFKIYKWCEKIRQWKISCLLR